MDSLETSTNFLKQLETSKKFLKQLETEWDLEAPLKVQVRSLRLKLRFLAAFFRFQGKRQINIANLKVRLDRVRAVVQNANKKLQSVWSDLAEISSNADRRSPANLDRLVSRVLESIVLIKPDLQQVYSTISKSSGSTTVLATDNDVMNLIYSLLESVEDLLRFEVDSIAPVRKEVEVVEVSLRFLRDFFGFIARRCHRDQNIKDLRTHVTVLAHNMACLLCLCLASPKMDDPAVHETKLALFSQLQKVKPIQPKVRKIYIEALNNSNLLDKQNIPEMDEFVMGFLDSLLGSMKELSETKVIGSMISIKVRILALQEKLSFFKDFMIDMSSKKNSNIDSKINGFVKCIIPLICEAGRVIYSFDCGRIDEPNSVRLSSALSYLIEKLKVTKEDTREIYLPMSLRSNFPRTNEMGFICSLSQNLKEILKFKPDSVAPLKHQFEEVHKRLLSLQKHFSTTAKHPSKHGEPKDQLAYVTDIAYLTEYVIDSFFIGDYPLWCYKLGLSYVTKMLRCIQMKLTIDTFVHEISSLPTRVPPIQADPTKIDVEVSYKDMGAYEKKQRTNEMVVFKDEAEKIMEQLTNRLPKLHILSIVGMPGVGKTTLADSIFENPSVARYFHVRARCCVSQAYQKRRLMLEILQQVTSQTEDCKKMCDEDLDQKVYQSLKGRTYLILLDDIWDIRPWKDMRSSFPNDNERSRIIFTSRLQSIASQVESIKCIPYYLQPLSDEKAWEMLQIKLFQKQSCPGELVKIGQQIAKNCKGLPLAVGLVAGVLSAREPKETCWQQVAENLIAELLDNQDRLCKNIIEVSYNNLPDHLKPCFLYFGAFPEDSEIPTRKLIPMWIAEGFVQLQNAKQRSLECVAETYLNELLSRSLITSSKRRSLGGVKASRVHDLLGEFARAKAKEDGFFLLMHHSTVNCHRLYGAYRLSIHGCPDFWQLSPSGPRIRSLLFHQNLVDLFYFRDIFKKLRLLRVLDLLSILCTIPDEIPLVHLRFLAVHCYDSNIMRKIAGLQNLETFQLNIDGSPSLYARELCYMKRLRHCHVNKNFRLGFLGIEEIERLDNLQTLAILRVEYNGKTEVILRQLPNLEGLKCEFFSPWLSTKDSIYFPKLGFLRHLKSLNMSHRCTFKAPHPCEFGFPAYLKKLTLSKFYWPWLEISIIGKLEHLEVLKLRDSAFTGKFWSMRDGEFPKLKFLSLCELDIEEWNASKDHLPCLERLKVHHCLKLEELPSCLADIATLKSIETKGCNPSAEMSAKSIKDEQEDVGNDDLVVNIY